MTILQLPAYTVIKVEATEHDYHITNAYTESLNSLIRVMDRMGRGYIFEALRAKILFTEGAHVKQKARPKFERRSLPDISFSVLVDEDFETLAMSLPVACEPVKQYDVTLEPVNYGADISTLVRLIEAGEL